MTEKEKAYQEYNDIMRCCQKKLAEGSLKPSGILIILDEIVKKTIASEEGIEIEFLTVFSRDLQRFMTSFGEYARCLEKTPSPLVRKLTSQEFFFRFYHEDSRGFKKLKDYLKNIRNQKLARKVETHVNSLVSGLFRELLKKYNNGRQ